MTHTYKISGMACNGCMNTVKMLLEKIEGINSVTISLQQGTADISMSRHIDINELQAAFRHFPQYQLTEITV